MAVMKENANKATQLLINAIPVIAEKDWSPILEEKKVIINVFVLFFVSLMFMLFKI